jgi:multisubunit Na+/H+ antiporter MnhB subunit
MTGHSSHIFRTVVRFLFFLVNVFALYLLLRGHNLPGGGFIAGLASAISLILLSLAIGLEELHGVMRFDPMRLATVGLAVSLGVGMAPMLFGRPFLEHFDAYLEHVPLLGRVHLGTPLMFDIGVFMVVVGITCKVIFVLGKSTQRLIALVSEDEARYSSPVERPIEESQVEGGGAKKERGVEHAD